ncbi:hypothetical protein CR152_15930 [Massilia violaceinigra]|uniref:DUF4007 domain-containing protein n=1 Tax=Massilia violaceinigra TaxID=2045208 RepID=A0A2D2DLJ0_9BURK|nr:DUF4007 family protein [Massilia violaceinigra]ATQ75848.1 hypothetical protein CR152_15930 [Massilia violaceinigra]
MKKITSENAPAHFSGHETFPLRQMWLKKAYDQAKSGGIILKSTFTDDNAIAEFGVGKNMVGAIRHWALACNVMTDEGAPPGAYRVTEAANAILSDGGLDPYSENPTTAWYAHWWLAGKGHRSTTWKWLFNNVTTPMFSREELEAALTEYARGLDSNRKLAPATLSRDIDTCLRGYAPRSAGGSPEEYAEPMLGELGLISEERKGHFAFRRGPKATLHDGMFAYALLDFWDSAAPGLSSLAFEQIAFNEGSPGRVFKLDEDSIAERLQGLENLTRGALTWTDTAGLKQVHRDNAKTKNLSERMIEKAYA